jgi:hypothetical protein
LDTDAGAGKTGSGCPFPIFRFADCLPVPWDLVDF